MFQFEFKVNYVLVSEACDKIFYEADVAILPPITTFNISNNLGSLIKVDSESSCIDHSMAIVITDIPCANFNLYPDINDMFGEGLNETIHKFNTEYYLHTLIFWLTANLTDKTRPCPELENYKFDNKTDAFEYHRMEYSDLSKQG